MAGGKGSWSKSSRWGCTILQRGKEYGNGLDRKREERRGPGRKAMAEKDKKGGGGAMEQNGCGGMTHTHETGDKAANHGNGKRGTDRGGGPPGF